MSYCILNSENVIVNIFVCNDPAFAEEIGGHPSYDGAKIGDKYDPPIPVTPQDRLEAQVAYTAMMTDTLIGG